MTIPLYFDIETIPDQREDVFKEYLDEVKPPANYKKEETINNWLLENAERIALETYHKTALNGLYGEICSIAWALGDGKIYHVTRGLDEVDSETYLLEQFWRDLKADILEYTDKTEDANWERRQWIGHNICGFDLRMLEQRSIICGVKPEYWIPTDTRPGAHCFDTMLAWSGTFSKRDQYVSQDKLCRALKIGLPDWAKHVEDTDGSKVWDLYRNGDFDLIGVYNSLDVWKVRELHKRMTFRD